MAALRDVVSEPLRAPPPWCRGRRGRPGGGARPRAPRGAEPHGGQSRAGKGGGARPPARAFDEDARFGSWRSTNSAPPMSAGPTSWSTRPRSGMGEPLKVPGVLVDNIRRDHIVYDVVYGQRPTMLSNVPGQMGARAIDGLAMLAWQAALSFELWTGRARATGSDAECRTTIRVGSRVARRPTTMACPRSRSSAHDDSTPPKSTNGVATNPRRRGDGRFREHRSRRDLSTTDDTFDSLADLTEADVLYDREAHRDPRRGRAADCRAEGDARRRRRASSRRRQPPGRRRRGPRAAAGRRRGRAASGAPAPLRASKKRLGEILVDMGLSPRSRSKPAWRARRRPVKRLGAAAARGQGLCPSST